ncbi:MAG: hypothetical protein M1275_00805 [Patescibacteria group bacterium]|nr:hypothetical protein [Patescibacteria group bacterium]
MQDSSETKSPASSNSHSWPKPVPVEFLYWYYFIAPRNILEIWGNYLVSNVHYFSLPILFRTLLSPWHRDLESYGRGFDLDTFVKVLGGNLVSRGVGLVVRSVAIFVGLSFEIVIFAGGLFFLSFWLAAPFALTASFFYGWKLIL